MKKQNLIKIILVVSLIVGSVSGIGNPVFAEKYASDKEMLEKSFEYDPPHYYVKTPASHYWGDKYGDIVWYDSDKSIKTRFEGVDYAEVAGTYKGTLYFYDETGDITSFPVEWVAEPRPCPCTATRLLLMEGHPLGEAAYGDRGSAIGQIDKPKDYDKIFPVGVHECTMVATSLHPEKSSSVEYTAEVTVIPKNTSISELPTLDRIWANNIVETLVNKNKGIIGSCTEGLLKCYNNQAQWFKDMIDKETAAREQEENGGPKRAKAYISGNGDGTYGLGKNATKAEVATMLYNLRVEPFRSAENVPYTYYTDNMDRDAWYYEALAYFNLTNVFLHDEQGRVHPNQKITRAEFAHALALSFGKLDKEIKTSSFKDVGVNHKYIKAIETMKQKGWIEGYPDGTFKPDNYIKREEMITLVNKALQRPVDKNFINATGVSTLNKFTDNKPEHWAFYDVITASNSFMHLNGEWTELMK